MTAGKLRYSIVSCDSQDAAHPVTELLTHSPATKGWLSAKFCDWPQQLTVQFEGTVHVTALQFLAHQFAISTRLDIYTAVVPDGEEVPEVAAIEVRCRDLPPAGSFFLHLFSTRTSASGGRGGEGGRVWLLGRRSRRGEEERGQ